jgi:hypothetical protein
MAEPEAIKTAVEGLDPNSDADWTASGLPSVDRVSSFVGETTRDEINVAAPGYDREVARTRAASPMMKAPEPEVQQTYSEAGPPAPETGPELPPVEMTDQQMFDMLDRFAIAAGTGRFRRNQVIQQIKLVWQQGEAEARRFQAKISRKNEMRHAAKEE